MNEKKSEPFVSIPDEVFFDRRLECSAKMVYGVIQKFFYTNKRRPFRKAKRIIAFNAGVSYRTVSTCLDELERYGYIKRQRDGSSIEAIEVVLITETTRKPAYTIDQMESMAEEEGIEAEMFGEDSAMVAEEARQWLPTYKEGSSLRSLPQEKHEYVISDDEIATSISGKAEAEQTFKTFWRLYPTGRGSKKETFAIWERMTPEERGAAIKCLKKWLNSQEWSGEARYIVHSQRFLRQRKWDDGDPTPKEAAPPEKSKVIFHDQGYWNLPQNSTRADGLVM